jgi:ABC-2 type transport system permease protein
MKAVFDHQLGRLRGQVLGWGIGLALLGLFIASFYGTVLEQQQQFEQMLKNYPEAVRAFFGEETDIGTPQGYLNYYYFSLMPIILGIFAVLVGSGLLASDEEAGWLDLIIAYPVSRTALFLGRALALGAATLVILAAAWLGLYLPTLWGPLSVDPLRLAGPFLSLLAELLLFGGLALFLSMLLPSRRAAASGAGLLLVASYFATSLARLEPNLKLVADLSPLTYYQSGEAMQQFNLVWFGALLLAAMLFAGLAWWRFLQRDIRVAGEGGWRWMVLKRQSRTLRRIGQRG